MEKRTLHTADLELSAYILQTVVVGSGAAGFNAADRLYANGVKDVAIVTENVNAGTSRNTGSDKQTYYKLTLSGGDSDSVREMAETLFAGQCVDGDIALCEAALSAQCFLKLAELGVPFPKNRWGEYIGYKTDHDPRRRATSVGPYTSKRMTECLERAVREKQIPIFDDLQVIRILTDETRARGLLCLNKACRGNRNSRYVIFCCENIVYATGGPAGMYHDSVYPACHFGASGLTFEAGVQGRNLTEWQFGLASVSPRWNVSGTYMQVLPRFVSTASDGSDAREFLFDFFTDKGTLLTNVFLKGYQWPFDVRKLSGGSSIIDILVYMESCKGRRVYLDFRENPGCEEIPYSLLSEEARAYLEKAGACFGTPLARLMHMNAPAASFYVERGVDLSKQMLEIALCAQHNNGGLAVDAWWQTNVPHLFAAGEVAGSHGVYRPGGSALNAGQVGSSRAAQYIAAKFTNAPCCDRAFVQIAESAIMEMDCLARMALQGQDSNIRAIADAAAQNMSLYGSVIRNRKGIIEAAQYAKHLLSSLGDNVKIREEAELPQLFRLRDMLISQYVYLCAMADYIAVGGKSRGSALYTDPAGQKPYDVLPEQFRFILDDTSRSGFLQEIAYTHGECTAHWRPVRPIPADEDFFENVWRSYRENGNTY